MRRYDGDYHKRDWEEGEVRLESVRPSERSLKRRRQKPKKRRSHKRRSSLVGPLVLLVILFAILLYGGYQLVETVFSDQERAPVTVTVEKGDTLSSVADKLEEAGVIESSTFFNLRARAEGETTEIKPGEYQFVPGEEGDKILKALANGDSASRLEVTIPEGLTLEQTASVICEATGIPTEEIEAAAKETDYGYAFLDDPKIQTTEGFLFPKKYEFEQGVDARQVIDRLLEQYLVETKDLDFEGAEERSNLTEYELITLASLVEREAANDEERPLVASVIYNRIRQKIPLQVDATVQYALGESKENLSLDDLKVDSPYNTYKNPGLPPGPIASPSRESIRAALEPAKTDYLYYVLQADGKEHFFTDDYDEFVDAKQKYEAEQESETRSLTVTH